MQNVVSGILKEITTPIRESVVKVDENVIQKVEKLKETNLGASYHLLDQLNDQGWNSNSLQDSQAAVLLNYLERFVPIFGHEKLVVWHSFFLEKLSSQSISVVQTLERFLPNLMERDSNFRSILFSKFFEWHSNCSLFNRFFRIPLEPNAFKYGEQFEEENEGRKVKNCSRIILLFSEKKAKSCFYHIDSFLSKSESKIASLELVALIAYRQGHRLHEIAETPLLKKLVDILKTEKDSKIVSLALCAMTMLIPKMLYSLSSILDDLLAILIRICLWNGPKDSSDDEEEEEEGEEGKMEKKERGNESSPLQNQSGNLLGGNDFNGDVERINRYLEELQRVGFHVGNVLKLRESLLKLENFKKGMLNYVQLRSGNEGSKESLNNGITMNRITEILNQISSVMATIQTFLTNEEELPICGGGNKDESNPPEEMKAILRVYFEHLYGIFPSVLYQFLRSQCASNKDLREVVTPFWNQIRVGPLFLSNREKELSPDREWKTIKKNRRLPSSFQNFELEEREENNNQNRKIESPQKSFESSESKDRSRGRYSLLESDKSWTFILIE
eukprot:TRINITY_DN4143_c0_g1_i2.p1 TRINITY_DN4143_c0_g1~~TRINITY_DN4143_c0_g1_i2.p1  ORF type:complete len:560 (+),score=248.90 TRINITY_DN4143_c0_g1_i2:201-1880(+)